jgi:FMN reductase (NADPH)
MSYSTPVTDVMNNHVTVRFYSGEPFPDEMLEAILAAARRAPTSSNMQTYSIIVVRDLETRKEIAKIARGQKHIETCEVFLAFCADIKRLQTAVANQGVKLAKSLELTMIATIDAAIVGMSAQTAAESFGLGGVMIGAVRNDPKRVAELLGLPQGVFVVYGMCLGWPDQEKVPPQKPRLPQDLVIHYEQYDTSDLTAEIDAYDDALAEHYGRLDRNQHIAAWSGPIAQRLGHPLRPHLRPDLEEMGFSFD